MPTAALAGDGKNATVSAPRLLNLPWPVPAAPGVRQIADDRRTADNDRAGKPGSAQPRPGAIREIPLSDPGNGGAGTLKSGSRAEGRGSLGANMWKGTPSNVVLEVLPSLPVRLTSPARRSLTRRLLLTHAHMPKPGRRARTDNAVSFVGLRLELLFAMGAVARVLDLSAAVGSKLKDGLAIKAVLTAQLLTAGKHPDCARLESDLKAKSSLFLERAVIVCHVLAGRYSKAVTGVDLLQETESKVSGRFRSLVRAQDDPEAAGEVVLARADGLDVALLTTGRVPLPASVSQVSHPAYLRAIALSKATPLPRRLAVAERAFDAGAISLRQMSGAYGGLKASEDALADAPRLSLKQYTPESRAVLYQAANTATEPAERLEVLAAWWRLSLAAREDWMRTARVTAPLAEKIAPGSRWQRHAHHLARVYLAVGDHARAQAWYGALESAPFRNPSAFVRLKALMRVALGTQVAWTGADLSAWVNAARRAGRKAPRRDGLALRHLMQGLGEAGTDATVWEPVAGESAAPPPRVWRGIRALARDRRLGETVMLVLINLGDRELAEIPSVELREAIGALREAGLTRDARRLAVEAAIALGM